MQKNYHKQMQALMDSIPAGTPLLLHSCCGPCSSSVLEKLAAHFAVTLHYYNPNIWPAQEYARRRDEQAALLQRLPTPYPVAFAEGEYDREDFALAVRGLEREPEGGARCAACFALRLDAAAAEAKRRGIGWLTTTLTVSPHKNAPILNLTGQDAAAKHGLRFLPSDFKKAEGYKRSLVLSEEYGLYRQDYCGCEYSYAERFGKEAQKAAGAGRTE